MKTKEEIVQWLRTLASPTEAVLSWKGIRAELKYIADELEKIK